MENFIFKNKNGIDISCYRWSNKSENTKGIIQIVHGMSEWAGRYEYFANKLTQEGYTVYAHDHSGHGKSVKNLDKLGFINKENRFYSMLDDIRMLNEIIKKENKELPVILFGHSMGSFLSQRYIQIYGDTIDGVILSGSNGKPKVFTKAGLIVSKIEMLISGNYKRSKFMDKLSFGSFNNSVKNPKTNFDWLSSDEKEVDKYIKDKYCGFIYPTPFYYDLIRGLWDIHKDESLEKIKNLNIPIYIFSGDKDPVGYFGDGVINLYEQYKELGVKDISYKLYKDGRHEMLNEVNKNEVIEDIIIWIKKL
ncbi:MULTISPECIES: alpha/beta hydrolase [Clostridium]|jgi:alpha-beta hydrolase superfamily lysophospholipase|uniref:Lysophospholipase n=1 Tax=Clostridium sartagoforme AAU1 TaxID=1202534 RepID=R9C9Z5_9CLOT|nr:MULTISPECIES: alpha/beta hydrolase [Clostridium]EOR26103.1 lysophospholipase [Clostridium sartagoforme AAU1]KLE16193.1 alpha/beta hydrolase [Clostridium sp. C8]